MSQKKAEWNGSWASPPTNTNQTGRPLTGRVIFGMLTEGAPVTNSEVITSAKKRG